MRCLTLACFVVSASLTTAASADDMPFPPRQSEICVPSGGRKILDKKKLARYLLQKYPFNIAAVPDSDIHPPLSNLDLSRRIIADPGICKDNKFCKPTDQASIAAIRGSLAVILIGQMPGYLPSSQVEPDEFIKGANEQNEVVCQEVGGKPVEAPGALFAPPPKSTSNFRVRGKASDLYVDRSQQKDFQATSSATMTFSGDQIASKHSTAIQGVIGYVIPTKGVLGNNGERLDIIPYVQGNDQQAVTHNKRTVTSQTIDGGLLLSAFLLTENGAHPIGHVINLRSDFLNDYQDGSQILSETFQYIPIVNAALNDFIRVIPERDDFASIKPIFDIRVDGGTYIDKGTNVIAASHPDYLRAGGQAGATLVSDSPLLPLTLTSTYTWLGALAGNVDIWYFSNSATLNLDPNKYFGITLAYSKGVREDTAKTEDLWTLGLSGKF